MSSTAEELASQAEQLQSTIAFFKTDQRSSFTKMPQAHKTVVKHLTKSKPALKKESAVITAKAVGADLAMDGRSYDEAFEKY
jgi:methyl-accepting chemotaxis protein